MRFRKMETADVGIGVAAMCLLTTGCGTMEFYGQAVTGQMEVLSKRKPIERVIKQSSDPALKERLRLTQQMLAFAEEELRMPSGGSYELYAELNRKHLVWVLHAELNRKHLVWVLHAAPELSLEARRWWYPVIGCQAYRGYFREELAQKEVARLQKAGYDTWLGGVDAFSTLGVFRDPVLDTFVERAEVDYAELIFHELVHRKYYVSGNTDFNEAMAEAVAREGVRRWFRQTGRPELVAKYQGRLGRLEQARTAISGAADRLRGIYASDRPEAAKRTAKDREIGKLKTRLRELRGEWGGGLATWIDEPINNARLNSFTTYESGVPRFVTLLEECGGDFATFWERVREVAP